MDRPISEQAVIDTIYESRNNFKNEFDQGFFADKIRALPPADPQPKTGHWIRWYEQEENEWFTANKQHCKCSECNQEYDPYLTHFIKYCNQCGARMIEQQEGSDKK